MNRWTPQQEEVLATAAARGDSLGMAAEALGVTRSAACAKAHRLGLRFKSGQVVHLRRTRQGMRRWWARVGDDAQALGGARS